MANPQTFCGRWIGRVVAIESRAPHRRYMHHINYEAARAAGFYDPTPKHPRTITYKNGWVEVSYPEFTWCRGEAWDDLMRNLPDGVQRDSNPWRKAHVYGESWRWRAFVGE